MSSRENSEGGQKRFGKGGPRRLKVFAVIATIAVISSSLAFYEYEISRSENFGIQTIDWGSFMKIASAGNYSKTEVYYISWIGCPIGAADS